MAETSHSVGALNRLLSCNRRTADFYSNVLPERSHDLNVWELIKIRNDHRQSYGHLVRLIHALGGRIYENDVKNWPSATPSNSVYVMDNKVNLQQMLKSERMEISECERILNDSQVEESVKISLRSDYLPTLRRHVDVLEHYLTISA